MKFELMIKNEDKLYIPVVSDGVKWTTNRKCSPGKLTFTVIKDGVIKLTEGDHVRLTVDNKGLFFGYVFTQKRDKKQQIEVTASDQLRYLSNKDTYVYKNKTASDVIKMVAADFNLNLGTIDQTEFTIEQRVESDTSLFDVIYNALDLEFSHKKKLYVLFDDFGKLTLKSLDNMKVDIMIDAVTGENFDYSTSIDEGTFNVVKYAYGSNKPAGTKVVFAPPVRFENGKRVFSESQKQWGILQYFLKETGVVKNEAQAQEKANALLSLYNVKTRRLKITKALGDVRVRAGSLVYVKLDLGDVEVKKYMWVEQCEHTFNESEHWMDLTLRGGGFVA